MYTTKLVLNIYGRKAVLTMHEWLHSLAISVYLILCVIYMLVLFLCPKRSRDHYESESTILPYSPLKGMVCDHMSRSPTVAHHSSTHPTPQRISTFITKLIKP